MKITKSTWAAVGAALLLAACGGGGDGNQAPKIKYSTMVSFGDSFSDVGTYAVGDVLASGGGRYTVNGITTDTIANPASKNWTERLAAQLGLPAPCAAVTGLAGAGFRTPSAGPVASNTHAGCFSYAQGGARVTNATGPINVANGDATSLAIGQLTVPVVTQISNHLALFPQFSGTELVTVMAGGNDVLQLLEPASTAAGNAFANSLISQLAAGATNPATAATAITTAFVTEAARLGATTTTKVGAAVAAAAAQPGNAAVASAAVYGPMVATATTAATTAAGTYFATNGTAMVTAMATAGAQLANLVNTQLVAKGAKYVAVLNLPDVSLSPASKAKPAAVQALIHTMVTTFNAQLKAGLVSSPNVILVDVYANINDQVANPSAYGLTNVTTSACDTTKEVVVSSMLCTTNTLVAGDVSHYLFAEDGGHPTPYELKLLSQLVARDLIVAGWL